MRRFLIVSPLLLLACQTPSAPPPEEDRAPVSAYAAPLAADACGEEGCACSEQKPCCDGLLCNTDLPREGDATCVPRVAEGGECWIDGQCKDGLFCSHPGYGPGECAKPQPDGASCASDTHCASKHCVDWVCQAWACHGSGQECFGGSCCPGLVCNNPAGTYIPGQCVEPLPAGAFCVSRQQCASSKCVDGICQ